MRQGAGRGHHACRLLLSGGDLDDNESDGDDHDHDDGDGFEAFYARLIIR